MEEELKAAELSRNYAELLRAGASYLRRHDLSRARFFRDSAMNSLSCEAVLRSCSAPAYVCGIGAVWCGRLFEERGSSLRDFPILAEYLLSKDIHRISLLYQEYRYRVPTHAPRESFIIFSDTARGKEEVATFLEEMANLLGGEKK